MGFESPQAIQLAILAEMSVDLFEPQSQNQYGQLYRAYIYLTGVGGISRRIRTVWIVLFDENIAKFVTAVPDRLGG